MYGILLLIIRAINIKYIIIQKEKKCFVDKVSANLKVLLVFNNFTNKNVKHSYVCSCVATTETELLRKWEPLII